MSIYTMKVKQFDLCCYVVYLVFPSIALFTSAMNPVFESASTIAVSFMAKSPLGSDFDPSL